MYGKSISYIISPGLRFLIGTIVNNIIVINYELLLMDIPSTDG